MLEPVPTFYRKLEAKIAREMGGRRHNISVHNIGLGAQTRTVQLYKEQLRGQGTSYQMMLDEAPKTGFAEAAKQTLRILSVEDALTELGLLGTFIDLLHMNCEGCEYDVLLSILDRPFWERQFGVVQFATHNYPAAGLGSILPRYCAIRQTLAATHRREWGLPFVWERWIPLSRHR